MKQFSYFIYSTNTIFRISFVFLLCLKDLLISIYAQHSQFLIPPPITVFTARDYNAHHQIFSATPLSNGTFALGVGSKILIYDGHNFRHVPVGEGKLIYSIAARESDTLWCGTQSDFGLCVPDNTGKLKFRSLRPLIHDSLLRFNIVWRTHAFPHATLFNGFSYMYLYIPDLDSVCVFSPPEGERFFFSHQLNDSILFVNMSSGGLWKVNISELVNTITNLNRQIVLKNSAQKKLQTASNFAPLLPIKPVKGAAYLKNVMDILPHQEGQLIITAYDGAFLLSQKGDNLIPWGNPLAAELAGNNLFYTAAKINNNYAIGTIRNGLYLFDQQGKLITQISREEGLPDNFVWNIAYQANTSTAVVCTDNGFALLTLPAAIHTLFEGKKYQGVIENNLLFFNESNALLFPTSQAMYLFHPLTGIQPVPETEGQISRIAFWPSQPGTLQQKQGRTGTVFIAGGKRGLFAWQWDPQRITQGLPLPKARVVDKIDAYSIAIFEDYLLAGGRDGLCIYRINPQGELVRTSQCLPLNEEPNSVAFYTGLKGQNDSVLYAVAGLRTNGIAVAEVNLFYNKDTLIKLQHYDTISTRLPGGGIQLFPTSHGLLAGTSRGLYRITISQDNVRTTPFCDFGNIFCNCSRQVFRLYEEKNGVVWIDVPFSEKDLICRLEPTPEGTFAVDSLFSYALDVGAIRGITPDGNGGLYIGGDFGLAHYSPQRGENIRRPFQCIWKDIRTQIANTTENPKDSLLWAGFGNQPLPILPYALNHLIFEWVAPYYYHQDKVEYHYALLKEPTWWERFTGKSTPDTAWSEWSKERKKEYTNLAEGSYTFIVEAQNVYKIRSTPAIFHFKITPIWYRSAWAYTTYAILSTGTVAAMILLLMARSKAKRKEREYLAEIERLSLVARETDNAVLLCKPGGKIVWVNDAFRRMTGYTLEEYKQQHGNTLQQASSNPQIQELINRCISRKETVVYESVNTTKDGQNKWIQTTLTPVTENGKLRWLVAVDADITAVKEAQQKAEEERKIAEERKQLVEQKNKEITDSITYAKRIQEAILPSESKWQALLPDSFVFYLPKDIVAGDFYWLEETEDYIFVAAADCTGHGVPGAMVSLVCSNALTKSVLEERIYETDKILNRTKEIVTEKLSASEKHIQDGMDVALVRISKKNRQQIQFSGANRPLLIVGSEGMREIKGDKQPVGLDDRSGLFTAKELELKQGEEIFMYTDGYADQFGGEKGKKMGNRRFKEILQEIYSLTCQEQKTKISEYFAAWKQAGEQLDDVTVVGIKV